MKRVQLSVLVVLLLTGSAFARDRDVLYQLSSMAALKAGVYDGMKPYRYVKERGDFGIGTFENIDGEMIELDGKVYQVRTDGQVYTPADSTLSCYATVTFLDEQAVAQIDEPMTYEELMAFLDRVVATNVPNAIRIEGDFEHVKTRSVPAQEKPYPPLDDVVAKQVVFELTHVTGTAVGFRFPAFMNGVQAPGYHLHFLTADRKAGGHLLDFRLTKGRVIIDETPRFLMELPP